MLLFPVNLAWADGPWDNDPATVRRVPRLGVEVPEQEASRLNEGLARLAGMIKGLQQQDNEQGESSVKKVIQQVPLVFKAEFQRCRKCRKQQPGWTTK